MIVADRLGEYLNLGIEGRSARGVGVRVSRPVYPVPLILPEHVLAPLTGERLGVYGNPLHLIPSPLKRPLRFEGNLKDASASDALILRPETDNDLVLSAEEPSTRILFMSGYTDGQIPAAVTADASWRFLQKPFSAGQLASEVRGALDRSDA